MYRRSHADCSICRHGYSRSPGFTCRRCSGRTASVLLIAILVLFATLVVVVLVLSYLLCGASASGAGQGRLATSSSWGRRLLSLKINIIVVQILTQVRTTKDCCRGPFETRVVGDARLPSRFSITSFFRVQFDRRLSGFRHIRGSLFQIDSFILDNHPLKSIVLGVSRPHPTGAEIRCSFQV